MTLNREYIKIILAAIFSLALLFPTAVQTAHSFENHEHEVCTDFSVHIHEKKLDCSICDFHFSTFNFKVQNLPEFSVIHSFHIAKTFYLLPAFERITTHYFLRGPPQLS